MVRLVEIYRADYHVEGDTVFNNWALRQTDINPVQVIKATEEDQMKEYLRRGFLPKDLDQRQSFTRLILVTGITTIVIGSLEEVSQKLNQHSKQLLHG